MSRENIFLKKPMEARGYEWRGGRNSSQMNMISGGSRISFARGAIPKKRTNLLIGHFFSITD